MTERNTTEKRTAGSYAQYLKIPELLRLQQLLSNPPHHDEMLFIIVHQVYELWFKQLLHEMETVTRFMLEGRVAHAVRLCKRLAEIQGILIRQVRVLETMTPQDFVSFRGLLDPASGFQSYQFRAVEFRAGLKDPAFLVMHRSNSDAMTLLNAAFSEPSLRDAWEGLLRQRGLDYPEMLPETEAQIAELERRRVETLRVVYEEREDYYDLYVLAEALIEFDENFLLWRRHHILMVERMIGAKSGTGGSEGVAYLRTTLDRKCFPELWAVRTHITQGLTY